jgi:hypothetical protein
MGTRPELAFFGRRGAGGYDAGCLVNHSENCVGLSNLFAPAGDATVPPAATALAAAFAPGMPVVGYERGAALAAMAESGFEPVGGLCVWRGLTAADGAGTGSRSGAAVGTGDFAGAGALKDLAGVGWLENAAGRRPWS